MKINKSLLYVDERSVLDRSGGGVSGQGVSRTKVPMEPVDFDESVS